MTFILTATSVLLVISIAVAFIVQGGFSKKRRSRPGFWRRFWLRQLMLVPIYVFVLLPGLMGCAGSRLVQTRKDEARYAGPILATDGQWSIQTRQTLRAENPPDGTPRASIEIMNLTPDGPKLRGYYLPQDSPQPNAVVMLIHGLFRSSMEIEPVAAIFRDLGADVFLLNLRNHGGSESRPFTFGWNEKSDVLAGVAHMREHKMLRAPLIIFGVSMGAVVAARAAPEIPELRGLVLDAPMTDVIGTAHRQLGRAPRGFGLPGFYVSLVLFYMETLSGFELADVRPIDEVRRLAPDVQTLFIGGGKDGRVPPDIVRTMFEAHPGAADHKTLWIEPSSRHGRVWVTDPTTYRQQLAELVKAVSAK